MVVVALEKLLASGDASRAGATRDGTPSMQHLLRIKPVTIFAADLGHRHHTSTSSPRVAFAFDIRLILKTAPEWWSKSAGHMHMQPSYLFTIRHGIVSII
jgi:hypothetical protein